MATSLHQLCVHALALASQLHAGSAPRPPEISASSRTAPAVYRVVPGLSRASYAVDEVFLRENNRLFTAVGVTSAVRGTIVLDSAAPSRSRIEEIVVDLRELTSDNGRRDRALREAYLESNRYPFATLTGATLRDMPGAWPRGTLFRYAITGDLSVHGTTRATIWRGEGRFAGDTLYGTATTHVKMSAFGIQVPKLLSLRSEDNVKLEIRFVAVAAR
jgi:polyisoprenoid-binding protein YceI